MARARHLNDDTSAPIADSMLLRGPTPSVGNVPGMPMSVVNRDRQAGSS